MSGGGLQRPVSDAQRDAIVLRAQQVATHYPVGSPKHRDAVLVAVIAQTTDPTGSPWTVPGLQALTVHPTLEHPRPGGPWRLRVGSSADVTTLLARWRALRLADDASPEAPLFCDRAGTGPIKRRALGYAIERAGWRIRLDGLTLLRLRWAPPR